MTKIKKMYKGVANSPSTYLKESLVLESTIIYVADSSVFGDIPNLAVIGEDQSAETILILAKRSDGGFDVQRAIEGNARNWTDKTTIARNFTNYDYEQLRQNIEKLNDDKVEVEEGKELSSNDYSEDAVKEVAKIKDKVDKKDGYGLSKNDFTDELKKEVEDVKNKVDKESINTSFENIKVETNEEKLNSNVASIGVIQELFKNIPMPELATALKDGLMSKELFNKLNDLQLATTIKDGLLGKEMFANLEKVQFINVNENCSIYKNGHTVTLRFMFANNDSIINTIIPAGYRPGGLALCTTYSETKVAHYYVYGADGSISLNYTNIESTKERGGVVTYVSPE